MPSYLNSGRNIRKQVRAYLLPKNEEYEESGDNIGNRYNLSDYKRDLSIAEMFLQEHKRNYV